MIELLLLIIVIQLSLSMYYYWFFQNKIHTKMDLSDIVEPITNTIRKRVTAFAKGKKNKPIVNDDNKAFQVDNDR